MKKLALFGWCVASAVVWLVAGWAISNGLLSLTGEMPLWLEHVIRVGFRVVYHDDTPDPEDMQTVAITLFILAVFAVFAVVVVWLRQVDRVALSRRHASRQFFVDVLSRLSGWKRSLRRVKRADRRYGRRK